MIRINLHDYHDELRKIEIQKRVVKSLAVVIVAIFFIMVSWLIEQARLDSIKSETRKLESQVAALKSQVEKVKKMVLEKAIEENKEILIDESKHKIIKSAHPSPFSARRGFFGSKCFSKTNMFLEEKIKKEKIYLGILLNIL